MDRKVEKCLKKITNDLEENKRLINKIFSSKKRDFDCILVSFICNKYNNDKKLKALEATLSLMQETNKQINDKSFHYVISNIVENGYTEEYIKKFIDLCLNYGMSINFTEDSYYNANLMQTIIIDGRENYSGSLINIYNFLKEKGLNILNTNQYYRNILHTFEHCDIKSEDKEEFLELYKSDRESLLKQSDDDILSIINEEQDIEYIDSNNENLLFKYTSIYYDEEYTLKIIEILLKNGLNPNQVDSYGETFIHNAIRKYHSEEYICKLLTIAIKYNYNINFITKENYNLIEFLIIKNRLDNNFKIISLLINSKIKIKDRKSIINLIDNKMFLNDARDCIKLLENRFINLENNEDIDYLNKLDKINKEDNNLIIIEDYKKLINNLNIPKKFNIIIGKEKIGKTTFLQYYYNINSKNNILIINKNDIIKQCQFIGEFKSHFFNIIRICAENKITLIIDDLDEIFSSNMTELERNEIAIVIRSYIKEYGLQILGTINKNKKDLICNNKVLNDLINENELNEPNDVELFEIIDSIIDNKKNLNNHIEFKDLEIKELFKKILLIVSNKEYKKDPNLSNIYIIYDIISNLINVCNELGDHIVDLEQIMYSINKCDYINKNRIEGIKYQLIIYENKIKKKKLKRL